MGISVGIIPVAVPGHHPLRYNTSAEEDHFIKGPLHRIPQLIKIKKAFLPAEGGAVIFGDAVVWEKGAYAIRIKKVHYFRNKINATYKIRNYLLTSNSSLPSSITISTSFRPEKRSRRKARAFTLWTFTV